MTAHVLLITLGPVQDFIAQARRTRDLWFGSTLLSELSRCCARHLAGHSATLIFPALPEGHRELKACLAPERAETGAPPLAIANKILATLPSGHDPEDLARGARKAVYDYWGALADGVKRNQEGLLAPGISAAWTEQIDTVIELSATWAPYGGGVSYKAARALAEKAIAARKNLRDFPAWTDQRGAVPKSSLDGARETVLAVPNSMRKGQEKFRNPSLASKYRIADGEQLDAVGLIKRSGGEPDQFVPLVNVALASWIACAKEHAPDAVAEVEAACQAVGVAGVVRPKLPCGAQFGFDASVLLPNRWRTIFAEQGLGTPSEADKWGKSNILPLLRRMSEPSPYVACLVADGDHMGKAINAFDTAKEHFDFSAQLAEFASAARRIVEQKHLGSLVYAGGDDVIAFLPLPKALQCAAALHCEFDRLMRTACENLPDTTPRPTLSVGLAIGHVLEGMGDLLALGRSAEKLAKGTALDIVPKLRRNALAVIVDKRSGGVREWRARWPDDPTDTLLADQTLFVTRVNKGDGMRLSTRKIYQIEALRRRFPRPAENQSFNNVEQERPLLAPLLGEVRRVLSRAGDGVLDDEEELFGQKLDACDTYEEFHAVIAGWVARTLIARTYADAKPGPR